MLEKIKTKLLFAVVYNIKEVGGMAMFMSIL